MAAPTFDPATGTYVDADGHRVDEAEILALLGLLIEVGQTQVRDHSTDLVDGELTVAGWAREVADETTLTALCAAALALGGWAALTGPVQRAVATLLAPSHTALESFAAAVQTAALSEAQIAARAALYPATAWGVYQETRRQQRAAAGVAQERNVLGGARDHCARCLEETGKGWVPVGTLSSPGSRTCLSNCRCRLEYAAVPVRA